jgi:hypothetical protein
MRIVEVDTSANPETPKPDTLMGLVQFLSGRAQDTDAQKQIDKNTFIGLARNLGVNITPDQLVDLVAQEPLSNVLEPVDPNEPTLRFKGAETPDVAMPVNKAQDIVAAAAKKAAGKDRGL